MRSLRDLVLVAALASCASHASPPPPPTLLTFGVDAPESSESYVCFGFDARALAGRWLRAIRWSPPPEGAVALHHASLYASPAPFPDGPTPCDAMPAAWTMHVWGRGGDALVLPPDVAIALAADTQRFIVQAHVLRTAAGPPAAASVTLDTTTTAPVHVAAFFGAAAGTPAIRPRTRETSTATCRASTAMHIVSSWPHMHRLGASFTSTLVRVDGTRATIVDVTPWSFDHQSTYAVDLDVAPGDGVETTCVWQNDGDAYVLPGLRSSDEMCGQGLVVWPAEAARWDGGCP